MIGWSHNHLVWVALVEAYLTLTSSNRTMHDNGGWWRQCRERPMMMAYIAEDNEGKDRAGSCLP